MINDLFGPGSSPADRRIESPERAAEIVESLKKARPSLKVVLTQGTYDILHVGHMRYLEAAKRQGDILIVGLDSDEKTKARKGDGRPIVGQDERLEMLCHSRHVDLIIIKEHHFPRWHIIKTIRPDILIVTKREKYTPEDLAELEMYCGEAKALPSQAETSTTAKIRRLMMDKPEMRQLIEEMETNISASLRKVRDFLSTDVESNGEPKPLPRELVEASRE